MPRQLKPMVFQTTRVIFRTHGHPLQVAPALARYFQGQNGTGRTTREINVQADVLRPLHRHKLFNNLRPAIHAG